MTIEDWLTSQPTGWLWLPETPDKIVPAVIRLEDGEPPAAFVWDALDPIPEQPSYRWPQEQFHPVVVGSTDRGDITLVDCHMTHGYARRDGTALRWTGNLEARAAYVGAMYPTTESLAHTKIRFRLDGTDLWSDLPLAAATWSSPVAGITVDTSPTQNFRIGDIDVAIRLAAIEHPVNAGNARSRHSLMSVEQFIEAESSTAFSLNGWMSRVVDPLRFLHAFTLGQLLPLRGLERRDMIEYPPPRKRMELDRPLVGSGIRYRAADETIVLQDPLVQLGDGEPQQLIDNWCTIWNDERRQNAIRRLLHAATDATSPKSQFNDLVEAAEGWHKAVHGGRKTLRERLESLALPAATWTASNYTPLDCAEVKADRDQTSHGDILPEPMRIHRHIRTLRMLLRYHIAVEVGVEPAYARVRAMSADRWF